MNHYVFLQRVTGSGGVQCYVAAMAKYLEQLGWHVVVISDNNPRNRKETCLISYLEKYRLLANPYTLLQPHKMPRVFVRLVLNQMINKIGKVSKDDVLIVESWNSSTALWGEMLAHKLGGRHFYWTATEIYRGSDKTYLEKLDFFDFKLRRRELFATIPGLNRLFEGYKSFKTGDYRECLFNELPIQNVCNEKVDAIHKSEWDICYIGRANKPYVPNIIKGVVTFASNHPEKQMQFIMVGDSEACRRIIDGVNVSNLKIIELGDLYPIPKILFKKINVVIAGSGSARHSADEGALTIIADSETCDSRGLLGYDTLNSVYEPGLERKKEAHYSFEDALERVLVGQEWKAMEYRWKPTPGIKECWENHELIIREASQQKEYYNIKDLLKGSIDYKAFAKLIIKDLKVRIKKQ